MNDLRPANAERRTAYARNADIERFGRIARRGDIPDEAVVPLAVIFAAMRNATVAIGPGHFPLVSLLGALPAAYVENAYREWRQRHSMVRLAA